MGIKDSRGDTWEGKCLKLGRPSTGNAFRKEQISLIAGQFRCMIHLTSIVREEGLVGIIGNQPNPTSATKDGVTGLSKYFLLIKE